MAHINNAYDKESLIESKDTYFKRFYKGKNVTIFTLKNAIKYEILIYGIYSFTDVITSG